MPSPHIKPVEIPAYVRQHGVDNGHFAAENITCTCGTYVFRSAACGHKHTLQRHYCGASIDLDSSSEDEDAGQSDGQSAHTPRKLRRARPGGKGFCFAGAAQLTYEVPVQVQTRCKRSPPAKDVRNMRCAGSAVVCGRGMERVKSGRVEKRQSRAVPTHRALPLRLGRVVTMLDEEEASSSEPSLSPEASPLKMQSSMTASLVVGARSTDVVLPWLDEDSPEWETGSDSERAV